MQEESRFYIEFNGIIISSIDVGFRVFILQYNQSVLLKIFDVYHGSVYMKFIPAADDKLLD